MKSIKNYDYIIAIIEKSNGNETVGTTWLEAKTFPKDAPIQEVMEWGEYSDGKIIITVDESSRNTNEF